jgi:hypothetical protein
VVSPRLRISKVHGHWSSYVASVYTRGGHVFQVSETREDVYKAMDNINSFPKVFIDLHQKIGSAMYGYDPERKRVISIKVDDIVAVQG